MARVVALIPDLLFGSRVKGMLEAAGNEVELVTAGGDARALVPGARVVVFDLASDALAGVELLASLREQRALGPDTRTLAFYSHVEADTRERALAAGFDLVVPRSRMAREGAELVARLADD